MFTNKSRRSGRREQGLSLIELILFIVIVSVGLAGILSVMNVTSRSSADPQLRKQAMAIAEALLEEISLAHFTFCDPSDANAETATSAANCASTPEGVGPEAGNIRPFDNVNDYVSAFGTPTPYTTDANDGPITINGNFTAWVTISEAALGNIPATDSLLVQVTVSTGNENIRLERYRTRYAPTATP